MEISICEPIRKRLRTPLPADFLQLTSVFVVDIDNGSARRLGSATLEQNLFGSKILIHGAVIIEVVASQIGEHRNIKRNAIHPLLLKRVRGNLHYRLMLRCSPI